eukprot:scaffold5005_cov98-Isochrysis_galbana.AAC.3
MGGCGAAHCPLPATYRSVLPRPCRPDSHARHRVSLASPPPPPTLPQFGITPRPAPSAAAAAPH